MKHLGRHAKRRIIFLVVVLSSVVAVGAAVNEYLSRSQVLSEQILAKAGQLRDATYGSSFNSPQTGAILAELKGLIKAYEENMVFAESPYPGEIVLGRTPAGDSTWLETLCDGRYDGLLKEIRIRRTGSRADYLRINDIEITYSTPRGLVQETFNENGRVKLYRGAVFKLSLPKPMKIRRIRISINHESTGLEVCGVPYMPPPAQTPDGIYPPVVQNGGAGEVLLGTTPGGDSTWLETLCSNPYHRPIREIRLRRTGKQASYLRINDIEITYLAQRGLETRLFNEGARSKLYYGDEFRLSLPQPMIVTKIRVLIDHESTGLMVYGLY